MTRMLEAWLRSRLEKAEGNLLWGELWDGLRLMRTSRRGFRRSSH